jgi:hypothetical protein
MTDLDPFFGRSMATIAEGPGGKEHTVTVGASPAEESPGLQAVQEATDRGTQRVTVREVPGLLEEDRLVRKCYGCAVVGSHAHNSSK